MLLEELALTYAPTMRKLHDWLESWEIGLFVGRRTERRPVAQLWGSIALLRKWLTPLNPPGLHKDINKAWLSGATDQSLCDSVDDRIDRALSNGSRLAENLRSSFQMLHSEIEEAGRKAHERNQRQIEILAAVFLVPTLIVGFFGANTWLPGQSSQTGSMTAFAIMSAALVLLTLGTVAYLWSSRRMERARDREVEEELVEMRQLLGYRAQR
jgi:Mg2+ and Co2+ transporter CorA